MSEGKNYILDSQVAEKKMRRMALEVAENNMDEDEVILAGVQENGSLLARSIQKYLSEISSLKSELIEIALDKRQPSEVRLSKNSGMNGKVVIIVDDVANSGKTLLYALKPFLDFHPKKIQAMVLVARSHNSFPVHPDYVGLSVATTLKEHVVVEMKDEKVKGAYLEVSEI